MNAWFLLVLIALLAGRPAQAQEAPLIADLSNHLVAITTGFTGTDVLLFGTIDGPGDVVVTVTGEREEVTVRRKERVAGIWINTRRVRFAEVPRFYAAASSRPVGDILSPTLLTRHQIGTANLRLVPDPAARLEPAELNAFRAALLRLRQGDESFQREVGAVQFLGTRLFRANLHVPATVPTGTLTVAVYLVRDGQVVNAQTTPLVVSKIGLGAEVYEFAHRQALLYGLIAVTIALVAGWGAGAIFRKQ